MPYCHGNIKHCAHLWGRGREVRHRQFIWLSLANEHNIRALQEGGLTLVLISQCCRLDIVLHTQVLAAEPPMSVSLGPSTHHMARAVTWNPQSDVFMCCDSWEMYYWKGWKGAAAWDYVELLFEYWKSFLLQTEVHPSVSTWWNLWFSWKLRWFCCVTSPGCWRRFTVVKVRNSPH